jgi:flagellar protein FliO/FliZ
MTRFTKPHRAARRAAVAASRAALPGCVLVCALLCTLCAGADPAQAYKPAVKGGSEGTPLNLGSSGSGGHTASSATGSGPSLVRTIVGLVIVIAVIWGLAWVLRQVKTGRTRAGAGSGLSSMATLPLGSGRTLHLVRAGREYLLLGSAEHGVVPIHRYTEQQARETGLLDLAGGDDDNDPLGGGSAGGRGAGGRGRSLQIPGANRTPGAPGGTANALVERLRDWTVRR